MNEHINLPLSRTRVLLIGDNAADADGIRELLNAREDNIVVTHAGRMGTALEFLSDRGADIILLNFILPDAFGLEGFNLLRSKSPGTPIVVLAGADEEELAESALKNGAQDYVMKARLDRGLLVRTIRHAIERQRIKAELLALTNRLRAANAQLEKIALVDPLTEVLNRRGLQQVLAREHQLSHRENSGLFAIFLDLDDFKQINDTVGHVTGDAVLAEVARGIRTSLRGTDHVARIGGDEFIILLPHTRSADALLVAEKVRMAVSGKTIPFPAGPVNITASLGLVEAPPETASLDELLARSHDVVRRSKRKGKNRVSFSWEDRAGGRLHTADASSKFLSAVKEGTPFRAVLQSIYKLADESNAGYEILSRWNDEALEMPDDFFRVSQEANILTFADHQCFKSCLSASMELKPGTRCHLNLFPSTLTEIPFETLLAEFPTERSKTDYCLELSAQRIVGEPSTLKESVAGLQSAGVSIALDDIGFGRSCLEAIVLLEPDIVKIDRKYIFGVANDRALQRTLRRLLRVAAALNSSVVAEGIESRDDLNVLKDLGIPMGQGMLWGKPA